MNYKEKAQTILRFFRITDENDVISLTNLTMIIMIIKICTTTGSFGELSGLAIAVIGYQFKRTQV